MGIGQSTSIQDNFLSAPSAASVPSYVKSPISISSGIPHIEIPFFSLPTHNKNININTGISYHPNNTGRGSKASDVGLGWSLYGTTNVIYQEVNPYTGQVEGDFYYSVMGYSGRFMMDDASPSFINISNKTNNKLNISATKVNGIYNFKIVDPLGTSYFLEVADRLSRVKPFPATFSTAYYLSRVVDVNNVELLNYEYQEDNYTISSIYGTNYPIKSLKVKKIVSHDFGEVDFNYNFNVLDRKSYTDPFELTSIELKNKAGIVIEKYGLQSSIWGLVYPEGYIPLPPSPCAYVETQEKRILKKILKYGKNGTNPQITEFIYNYPQNDFPLIWSETHYPTKPCFDNEPENPKYLAKALLTSVKFPNGTKVVYEYELNQYYVNKNTDYYKTYFAPPNEIKDREAQYFEDIKSWDFDTNISSQLRWNLPPNSDNLDGASYLQYWVNVDEYYPNPLLGVNEDPIINVNISGGQNGKYLPGLTFIDINGTGGKGTVYVQRIRYNSVPLANYSTGKGVRVKKIEYYDGNTLIPSQTRTYEYQDFDDSTQPSGILNEADDVSLVYRNVKETIGQGNGYTKYYFKTLADYPQNVDANGFIKSKAELDYYDILANGVIHKKEIYNNDNILLAKEIHNYEYYQRGAGALKKSLIKKHFLTAVSYRGSDSLSVNSESTIETVNQNVIYTKKTEADGTINESNITFAWEHKLLDPKLLNAGIIAIPIIVETKKKR
jgi:hypothetical protein